MLTSIDLGAFEAIVADLLEQINQGRTAEELLTTIYDRLHGVIPYNRIAIALLQEDGQTLRLTTCRADAPESLKVGYSDPVAGSTLDELLRTGRPRILNDLQEYLRRKPDSRSTRLIVREGMRSNLTLPLLVNGKPIGVMFFSSRKSDCYNEGHVRLLRRLAGTMAIVIEKAQLVAHLQNEVERLTAQLSQENVYLRDEIQASGDFGSMVGQSAAMKQLEQAIRQVAPTGSTVLILGETGTGKERIARAIHDHSPRRERLLVKVHCAALAPGLVTSELFGHEAGAFTGAVKARSGRFEVAHQGSLFLDEIAEISPETQVLLLRVLQERVIERVGSHHPTPVDVRVIAATNRDLQVGVQEGWFRADLFYRLNVFPLRVPSLRERPDDIEPLVHHFVELFRLRMGKRIAKVSARSLELLRGYHWPGNVRELENLIERAVILCPGETLEVDPAWFSTASGEFVSTAPLADVEKRTILEALEASRGKIYGASGAAARLGLKPTTLYGKMRKHRIARKHERNAFE